MRAGNLATVASLLLACLHSKIAVQVPEQYILILVKEKLTTSSSNPQGKFARPRLNKKKKTKQTKTFHSFIPRCGKDYIRIRARFGIV